MRPVNSRIIPGINATRLAILPGTKFRNFVESDLPPEFAVGTVANFSLSCSSFYPLMDGKHRWPFTLGKSDVDISLQTFMFTFTLFFSYRVIEPVNW